MPQVTWSAARLTCACSHQAELASITSEEENSLIFGLAGVTENTWIGDKQHDDTSLKLCSGAHDAVTEGTFTWSDDTAWSASFTKWKSNAPNNGGATGNQVTPACHISLHLTDITEPGLRLSDHGGGVG